MNLEASLHLPEADVLAHLKLDQVLPAVDDLEGAERGQLADVACKRRWVQFQH